MKTCILGLMLLGLTNLTFSQNEVAINDVNSSIELPEITTNRTTTTSHADGIVFHQASQRITAFQNAVSKYDITSNAIYTPKKTATYTVVFKEANNVITNVYNHEGDAISSVQNYKNVRLPITISASILKDYPNWSITGVHCTIKTDQNKDAIVSYKVKIINGNKRKTIKVID